MNISCFYILLPPQKPTELCHVYPENGGWCTPRLTHSPEYLLAIAVASEMSWRHALPRYKTGLL